MKTRIIHTKFWTDNYVRKLKRTEKFIYFYLLTNEFINILDIYELPIDIAAFQTGVSVEEIENVKNKLKADGKIDFIEEWIFLKNAEKYAYYKGIKNNKLKLRLLIEMGNETFDYFKNRIEIIIKAIIKETDINNVENKEFLSLLTRVIDRGIDKGMGILLINQKPETRIPNTENRKSKLDITNNQEEVYDAKSINEGFEEHLKHKRN